ncbi:Nudix family hydrolase [Saccharophagus degradans]|uniref:Nudix family hydrolase n=1 Tax=Saccharophagus degradans TaxID=86304 RepID=UPI002477DB2C|nr:Nudix family hydrolase [Saccharophagus degradans]WGO97699.1 Nudix family hydrolase [Saccharophagus degradans]
MPNTEANLVHVAVGVIKDTSGNILIAKRPEHVHMGGRWEFPGGKVERNESVAAALARELHEELGIDITGDSRITPLITIRHQYSDKTVLLDVRIVEQFGGEPTGKEGQPLRWVPVASLQDYTFPDANYPIISALQLPRILPISPAFFSLADCVALGEFYAQQRYTLWHMRSPNCDREVFTKAINRAVESVGVEAGITVNTSVAEFERVSALHLHLNSAQLLSLKARPQLRSGGLLSASCHNLEELNAAHKLGVEYVLFSPVNATASHPSANAAGWSALQAFCAAARVPVYALGGVGECDVDKAIACGAQGVAGISAFSPVANIGIGQGV